MGNGINKVLPNLYLGNFKDARDREQLARNNITHILSVHECAAPMLPSREINVAKEKLTPTDQAVQKCSTSHCSSLWCFSETQHFKESIMFMHECRLKGEGCLVHCLAGVSRSVTLVIAYIMTMTGLGWQDVLNAVRVVRPCANPNLGFQKQLQEFEDTQAEKFREWFQMTYKDNPFNDTADILKLLGRVPDVNQEGMENHVSTPLEGI